MSERFAPILLVVVMVAVIVGVDVAFLRDRFWLRLATNVAIVLVAGAVYFWLIAPRH